MHHDEKFVSSISNAIGWSLSRALCLCRMSLAPLAQTVALKSSEAAQLLAAKDGDFGGYTGPIVGLLIIGIIIAVLTPAVKE